MMALRAFRFTSSALARPEASDNIEKLLPALVGVRVDLAGYRLPAGDTLAATAGRCAARAIGECG
jgi:hypothetical protein